MIIKDDRRYEYTQKFLERKKIIFTKDLHNTKYIDFILFPFKEKINEYIYNEFFFRNLTKNTKIFSGIKNRYLELMCKRKKLSYEALLDSDYVAILNAVPTAEGVISYLIQNRNKTIMGSRILIIGNGRCGKILIKKLFALGAKVFVNTLEELDYVFADIEHAVPIRNINFSDKNLFKNFNNDFFDVIINTAPCETISENNIRAISNKTMLIDITKFGFNIDIARQKNKKSIRLLSIPAKFALKTAGEILGEYIFKRVSKC
jgi:dipicolinate synthase subunit A